MLPVRMPKYVCVCGFVQWDFMCSIYRQIDRKALEVMCPSYVCVCLFYVSMEWLGLGLNGSKALATAAAAQSNSSLRKISNWQSLFFTFATRYLRIVVLIFSRFIFFLWITNNILSFYLFSRLLFNHHFHFETFLCLQKCTPLLRLTQIVAQ